MHSNNILDANIMRYLELNSLAFKALLKYFSKSLTITSLKNFAQFLITTPLIAWQLCFHGYSNNHQQDQLQ